MKVSQHELLENYSSADLIRRIFKLEELVEDKKR